MMGENEAPRERRDELVHEFFYELISDLLMAVFDIDICLLSKHCKK
jgi:hypothetical protein